MSNPTVGPTSPTRWELPLQSENKSAVIRSRWRVQLPRVRGARPGFALKQTASVDSVSVRAKRGGEQTGPNPTDRGKAGSKDHFLVDRQGLPLAVQLTAANVHDTHLLETLVDAVQPIRRPLGQPGRPRRRPVKLRANKAYASRQNRQALRRRGI
jgi:hypothetical protein